MKTKTMKTPAITFRFLPSSSPMRVTLAKRLRAFVLSSCGNVVFADTSEGPWLEIDLAEALNAIVSSRYYDHDTRHPVVAAVLALR